MKKYRILIADDLETQRELYRALLARSVFRVDLAEDGEQAVAMFNEACASNDPYDLVLLDGAMPNLSGLGAAEQILSANPKCDAMIYFLTNLDTADPTLNLRVRMMNIDPQTHILAKNDVIQKLSCTICGLVSLSEKEARGQAGN